MLRKFTLFMTLYTLSFSSFNNWFLFESKQPDSCAQNFQPPTLPPTKAPFIKTAKPTDPIVEECVCSPQKFGFTLSKYVADTTSDLPKLQSKSKVSARSKSDLCPSPYSIRILHEIMCPLT